MIAVFLAVVLSASLPAQTVQTVKPPGYQSKPTPTQSPSETPRTAPQVKQVLPSYEGQQVLSVEIAGQPDVNPTALVPLLQLRDGQPFSEQKVDASIAALKRTGRFHDVTLEVRPGGRYALTSATT